jgi:predicted MFS family arabinose efflux permease
MNQVEKTPPALNEKSDPRAWPVATVMAMGIFATTFVQLQSLGYPVFNHLLMKNMGLDSSRAATFMSLSILPWTFKVFAGLLVDGVPVLGSRRRNYLLLSAFTAAALWVAIGLAPTSYNLLLALVLAMNVAVVFGSATSGALLVEAGQKFGASGRLSSLRVFAQTFGNGVGLWIGGLLAGYALGWTSAVAILPLVCMFFVTWFLQRESATPAQVMQATVPVARRSNIFVSIWLQIRNVLRREMLLPALLMFFIQAVPTFRSTSFYEYQTTTLKYSDANYGALQSIGCYVSLLSTGIYALWCRKVSLRTSLYVAIFVTSLSALPYLFYAPYQPYMLRAAAIESVGTFLVYGAYLPLMDLAVRSTPKGSEALGYSLLISVWNIGLMIGTKTGPWLYENVFNRQMNSLIWLNAGVTLAGVIIVFLLPKKLVERREGS